MTEKRDPNEPRRLEPEATDAPKKAEPPAKEEGPKPPQFDRLAVWQAAFGVTVFMPVWQRMQRPNDVPGPYTRAFDLGCTIIGLVGLIVTMYLRYTRR
jgi:hypothetical protein